MYKVDVEIEGKVYQYEFNKKWEVNWFVKILNTAVKVIYWWYGIKW